MDVEQRKTIRMAMAEVVRSVLSNTETKQLLAQGIPPSKLDRKKYSKLFETCVAYDMGLLLWEMLPPDVLDKHKCLRTKSGKNRDFGIDVASPSLDVTAQAKWYGGKSTIAFTSITNFVVLSETLKSKHTVLVRSEDARVQELVWSTRINEHRVLEDRRIDEICREVGAVVAPADTAPQGLVLRGYQETAVETAMCELVNLSSHHRIGSARVTSVQMACGTGKSAVVVETVARFLATYDARSALPILVIVPSVVLLDQLYNQFATWKPDLILARIGGGHKLTSSVANVVITTIQSVAKASVQKYSLCVIDEAHHVAGAVTSPEADEEAPVAAKVWLEGVKSIKARRFLLASATLPVWYRPAYYLAMPPRCYCIAQHGLISVMSDKR